LIGGHQEIDRGNNEQDDASQGQHELHGMDPLEISDKRGACSASPAAGCRSNRIIRHCLSLSHTQANRLR
jgi:hypothetical protein